MIRIRTRSRRQRLIAGSTCAFVAVLGVSLPLNPEWVVPGLSRISPEVTYFVETERPAVALTIDDGPDALATPLILDVLRRHEARATFFVVSSRVAGNEHLVARMLDEGHEIANHLVEDEPSILLPAAEFEEKLGVAQQTIARFEESRWFRPGHGWYDAEMIATAGRYGYSTVLGSVYPFDAQIPSAWFAERYVLAHVHPGAIIVLHDVGERGVRTAKALEAILPALRERGLQVTTLTDLAGLPAGNPHGRSSVSREPAGRGARTQFLPAALAR